MRKSLLGLIFLFIFLFSLAAIADPSAVIPVEDPTLPPDWLYNIMVWVQNLPYVGPVAIQISKWAGVVAVLMTMLSYAAEGILSIPEIAARWKGAVELADKIKFWSDKIVYCLKYFSIRNAKPVLKEEQEDVSAK